MDIERLVVTMLDAIDEAYDDGADEVVFRFNKDQIEKIAFAYRDVEDIEIN